MDGLFQSCASIKQLNLTKGRIGSALCLQQTVNLNEGPHWVSPVPPADC